MLFDINGGEFLVIVILALVLVGPDRLPQYAAQLGRLVKRVRTFAVEAKDRVADELGPEVADVDWSKLDPRTYDPRRIVRDALLDDGPLLAGALGGVGAAARATANTPAATAPPPSAATVDPAAPAAVGTAAVGIRFDPDAT